MARLFQVNISQQDGSDISPAQTALLNPVFIHRLDNHVPAGVHSDIMYKKNFGATQLHLLIDEPVSSIAVNTANTTNAVSVLPLIVVDPIDSTSHTRYVNIADIWKVIADPTDSAYSYVLVENAVNAAFESLHCHQTLAAILALAVA